MPNLPRKRFTMFIIVSAINSCIISCVIIIIIIIIIIIMLSAGCSVSAPAPRPRALWHDGTYFGGTANLRTEILDLRGSDSSISFITRDGVPRPIGDFPETLSQAILVGIILVGRLGVPEPRCLESRVCKT